MAKYLELISKDEKVKNEEALKLDAEKAKLDASRTLFEIKQALAEAKQKKAAKFGARNFSLAEATVAAIAVKELTSDLAAATEIFEELFGSEE